MYNSARRYSYPIRSVPESESTQPNQANKKEENLTNIKKEEDSVSDKKNNTNTLEENEKTVKLLESLINEKFEKLEKTLLEQKTPYEKFENNLNEIKSLNIELVGRKRKKDEEKSLITYNSKSENEKTVKIPVEKKEKKVKKIKIEAKSNENELPGIIKVDGEPISSLN